MSAGLIRDRMARRLGATSAALLIVALAGPVSAQSPAPDTTAPTPPPPQTAAPADPLDTSALRYYVSIGDMERVEAEIRRLRSIDPSWQPPPDLLGGPAVDENALWSLFSAGEYGTLRARIAELQRQVPGYQPSADLLRQLDLAEAGQRLVAASDAQQWAAVIEIGRQNPDLLTCARADAVWRTAEAFARSGDTAGAFSVYRGLIDLCTNQQERIATLQKADAFLSASQMAVLYESAEARTAGSPERAAEIAETRAQLEAGRGAAAPAATAAPAASPRPASGTAPAATRPTALVDGPRAPAPAVGSAVVTAYETNDYQRCLELTDRDRLALGDALMRGWCLYEQSRPTEAAALFDRVRNESSNPDEVQAATFGSALTLLRRGRITEAVSAARAGSLTESQRQDVFAEALAQGATQAYEREDWAEVERLLQAREQLAVERRDLSILRGFALYQLRRLSQAEEIFLRLDNALSTPESREGLRVVRAAMSR